MAKEDGDDSWREFYGLYNALIYSFARRKGLEPEDAKEVVQETLITLMQELPSFRYNRAKGSFKGWLMRITHSRVVDLWRKRGKNLPFHSELHDSITDDFERVWDEHWRQELLNEAFRKVCVESPHNAQIYHLSVIEGKGAVATARILQQSVASVHMATFKAKRLIAKHVASLRRSHF